jgi:integrase
LLHLTTTMAPASVTQALSALRFFYERVLVRPWTVLDLARPKRDKKLPVVLSRAEVKRVLAAGASATCDRSRCGPAPSRPTVRRGIFQYVVATHTRAQRRLKFQ